MPRPNTQRALKFILQWKAVHRSGGRVAEVARRMKMRPKQATFYASMLRGRGVKLPKFKRGHAPK